MGLFYGKIVFDYEKFSKMVARKRGTKTLREVGAEVGVAAATVMRAEQGRTLDLTRAIRLVRWLGVKMESLLKDDGTINE